MNENQNHDSAIQRSMNANAFAEPAPFAALRAGFRRTDPTSTPRFHLCSRSDDPSRRFRRVLKGRLGHFARPEGRLLAVFAFHRQIYSTHTLEAQCAYFGFSSPSSRSPSSLRHSTHNAAASTCTGTRDAMDRTSHRTPDRPRTAAATPLRHQDHVATQRRGVTPIQLRKLSGRRALDTTARRRYARTRTNRQIRVGGFHGAAKPRMISCGVPGIRTVGLATWWTMSCRSAPAGRTRRATCSGRPSRKGR